MKGIPKNDIIWVLIKAKNGKHYYITSKRDRTVYYMYEDLGDEAKLLGQSKSPKSLEEKFIKQ